MAAAERVKGACRMFEMWLTTTDEQVKHIKAARDLQAHPDQVQT